VVWEESIILAPKAVRFAFLSATIPNAREFAEWVAKTHGSPCHVVYTGERYGRGAGRRYTRGRAAVQGGCQPGTRVWRQCRVRKRC
jgi:hypothetical protein